MGKLYICRALADDANVVDSILPLPKIAKVFDAIGDARNLRLELKKCMLIPLGCQLTKALNDRHTELPATSLPQWSNVRIASCGGYLGFWIGPLIMDKVWN